MVKLAIKAVIYAIAMLSSWLEGRDKNEVGTDDAIAAALEEFGKMLEEYDDNGVNRKAVIHALASVEVLCSKLDSNDTGLDDSIARQIRKVKDALK